MRDRIVIRKMSRLMLALGLSLSTTSCGGNGAANNDQGMSVTFLGLFSSTAQTAGGAGGGAGGGGGAASQGCLQLPTGVTGGYIRLGEVAYVPPADSGSTTGGQTSSSTRSNTTDPAGGYLSVVGLQNNLYGQAFRTERVVLDYFIPGANAQPPSTTVPLSTILGPAESALGGGTTGGTGTNGSTTNSPTNAGIRRPLFTSLPPTFSSVCNRALAEVTIVPSSIREWLNFNRDLLPEPPFKMEVVIRVSGISSSGNRYETNDGVFDFDILAESSIVPPIPTVTTAAISEGTLSDDSNVGDLAKIF